MNENNNAAQQPNATQAVTEEQQKQGRTFTQEEVNQIVSDRLARERSKNEPSPTEKKEQELAAREARLACVEYITEKKYPKSLLEIFSTSDADAFKGSVEKLLKAFPNISNNGPGITVSTGGEHGDSVGTHSDLIANAFARKGR